MSNLVSIPLKEAEKDDLFSFFQERFDMQYNQNEVDINEYELTLKELKKKVNAEGPWGRLLSESMEKLF
jgi:hypothetical protein